MFRLFAITVFAAALTFTTGCGRSNENTVIQSDNTPTQTEEEETAIQEEREAAMDSSNLLE